MNMQILKPFVDGTIHTLEVQLKVQGHAGKPFIKDQNNKGAQIDIAGVVGIVSSSFTGNIGLCFPTSTFLLSMEKMLGEPYTEITDEIADGAGELMNMIFGYAKKILNGEGFDLGRALPTVIVGENLRIKQKNSHTVIVLPFDSTIGPFQLEIGIEQIGEKNV